MPDLSQALAVLRSMRAPMSPEVSTSGAGWGHGNTLAAKRVTRCPRNSDSNAQKNAPPDENARAPQSQGNHSDGHMGQKPKPRHE